MKAMYLAPMGVIEESVLETLEVCLWQVFGFEVRRMSPFPDPQYAYDDAAKQYNSALILKSLIRNIPKDSIRMLGITQRDLFIPMLSFVFGHAQVNGPVAVISLDRLRQEFYQLPGNDAVFLHRVMKEAVHEVGHTFGLIHCPDQRCAMSLSNAIQQVDKKSDELCSDCTIIFNEITHQLRRENGMEMRR